MSKAQSGGIIILIGVVLQVIGRLIMSLAADTHDVTTAGAAALLMFASVVFFLFGLFRIIMGLASK